MEISKFITDMELMEVYLVGDISQYVARSQCWLLKGDMLLLKAISFKYSACGLLTCRPAQLDVDPFIREMLSYR